MRGCCSAHAACDSHVLHPFSPEKHIAKRFFTHMHMLLRVCRLFSRSPGMATMVSRSLTVMYTLEKAMSSRWYNGPGCRDTRDEKSRAMSMHAQHLPNLYVMHAQYLHSLVMHDQCADRYRNGVGRSIGATLGKHCQVRVLELRASMYTHTYIYSMSTAEKPSITRNTQNSTSPERSASTLSSRAPFLRLSANFQS